MTEVKDIFFGPAGLRWGQGFVASFGGLARGVAGGEFEEGVAGAGVVGVERGDEAEVAGNVDALDVDNLHEALLELIDDIDVRHEADAESGDDEALEEFARVELHGDAAGGLVLDEEMVDEFAAAAFLGDEELVPGGVGEGGSFDERERVAGGHDEDEPVLVDEFDVEAGVADGEGDDAELDLAAEDEFEGLRALGADDVEGDLGVLLLELADEDGKDVEGGGVVGADGERAARGALHVGEGEADLLELDEGVLGEGLEGLAGGGEGDLAATAVEESVAEVGLERPDLGGDGGLGHVQLFGGAGEALLPRYFEESRQPVEVQVVPQQ